MDRESERGSSNLEAENPEGLCSHGWRNRPRPDARPPRLSHAILDGARDPPAIARHERTGGGKAIEIRPDYAIASYNLATLHSLEGEKQKSSC